MTVTAPSGYHLTRAGYIVHALDLAHACVDGTADRHASDDIEDAIDRALGRPTVLDLVRLVVGS